jgi:hypothetical protein
VDEEPNRRGAVLAGVGEVAGDLCAPSHVRRARSDAADKNASRLQVDEEQDVQGAEPDGFHGEEVAGDDRRCLGAHELRPCLSSRGWRTVGGEDAADAGRRHLDADLTKFALDAPVAPGRVLSRESDDEHTGRFGDGVARDDAMLAAPLASDEFAMPTAQRVWGHQRGQAFADWSEPRKNSQGEPFFGPEPRPGYLAAEHVELLA